MKKIIAYTVLVFVLLGLTGLYFFNKEPADVRELQADFNLTTDEILDMYTDEKIGNETLLGKVVAVSGTVTSVERSGDNWTVYLSSSDPMTGVTCSFYPDEAMSVQQLQVGDQVTIKGVCTGKIIDVVLNHCSITK